MLILLHSCATMSVSSGYNLHFEAEGDSVSVCLNHQTKALPNSFYVTRSKQNLEFDVLTETDTMQLAIKPVLTNQFLFGNLLFGGYAPVGYIYDLTNEKRFTYGDSVTIAAHPQSTILNARDFIYRKNFSSKVGQVNAGLAYSFVSILHFQPEGEGVKHMESIMGGSMLLEYYYRKTKYLNGSFSFVQTRQSPFIYYSSLYDASKVYTLSLSDNFKWRRMHVGYGLHVSHLVWELKYNPYYHFLDGGPSEQRRKEQVTFGFVARATYQITPRFFMGVEYVPSVFSVQPDTRAKYQSVFSFNMAWKIPLN